MARIWVFMNRLGLEKLLDSELGDQLNGQQVVFNFLVNNLWYLCGSCGLNSGFSFIEG